jgi:DNA-binding transcriptional ArsR family regulator
VPKEERLAVVSSLREVGMSTRAIEAATGISKSTVGRALSSGHPLSWQVAQMGQLPSRRGSKFRATVIGIDGKPYPAQSMRAPARPPLENQLQSAVRQMAPGVRCIAQLRTDDRLADQRKAIAARSVPEMRGAAEVLNEFIAYLSDGE